MSRYLLDTDVLIDDASGKEPAVGRIKGLIAQGDDLGLCAIDVAKGFAGLRPHQRNHRRRVVSTFISWAVSLDAARRAGVSRPHHERVAAGATGLPYPTAFVTACSSSGVPPSGGQAEQAE